MDAPDFVRCCEANDTPVGRRGAEIEQDKRKCEFILRVGKCMDCDLVRIVFIAIMMGLQVGLIRNQTVVMGHFESAFLSMGAHAGAGSGSRGNKHAQF